MLQGLRVVVTNVTHFVGLPAALEMARQGATVVVHDRSFADGAARAAFHEA
jgi:NAD(P)-dependent dehydrogenase (short-subunit alcohol dehydrogenase family)